MSNPALWTVNATCVVDNDVRAHVAVRFIDEVGSVNGRHLATGESLSLVVHSNQAICVQAEPGARVVLKNMSDAPIQATCSS
jgi:hypothetical protein